MEHSPKPVRLPKEVDVSKLKIKAICYSSDIYHMRKVLFHPVIGVCILWHIRREQPPEKLDSFPTCFQHIAYASGHSFLWQRINGHDAAKTLFKRGEAYAVLQEKLFYYNSYEEFIKSHPGFVEDYIETPARISLYYDKLPEALAYRIRAIRVLQQL